MTQCSGMMVTERSVLFLGHLVLYEPNDRCDDRPSDAAANCLTEESTNIHAAGCTAQHRHKCGEDLTSNAASNCARDGVARRAEAHVLRRRARCIATECTGYNLNYEIDECCGHVPSLAHNKRTAWATTPSYLLLKVLSPRSVENPTYDLRHAAQYVHFLG